MTSTAERTGEVQLDSYSPEEIADLVLNSFRFSRGHGDLQKMILSYIAENFRERLMNNSEAMIQAPEIAIEKATAVISNRQAHPPPPGSLRSTFRDNAEREVLKYFGYLAYAIDGAMPTSPLDKLKRKLLAVDWYWYNGEAPNPSPNIFKSNVVHHGLLARPTGAPEYDVMFSDVKDAVLGTASARSKRLATMVEDYKTKYPQRTEELQTLGLV